MLKFLCVRAFKHQKRHISSNLHYTIQNIHSNHFDKRSVFTEIREFPIVDASPVSREEFEQNMESMQKIFSKLSLQISTGERFGICVSGGADSMSLALLCKQWADSVPHSSFHVRFCCFLCY